MSIEDKVITLKDGGARSNFTSPKNLANALSALYRGKHVSLVETLPSGILVTYFISVKEDNIVDTYTGEAFDINVLWG